MSFKSVFAKTVLGALAASSALIAVAIPASAHASVQLYGSTPTAGGYGHMFIRIPHGCDGGLSTDTIKVQVPAEFASVKPQAKAGWNVAVVKAAGQPTEITWSGGSLLDANFDDFGISVKYPSIAGTYPIPTVQYCGTATVAWVEVPAAGQDSHSLAKPAPTVNVAEKSGGNGHGSSAAPGSSAAKWTGDVAVDKIGKHSVRVVVDASAIHRSKLAKVSVVHGSKSTTLFTARLDARGDMSKTVKAKTSRYHIMEGSTIEVSVGGKVITSTTYGKAGGH